VANFAENTYHAAGDGLNAAGGAITGAAQDGWHGVEGMATHVAHDTQNFGDHLGNLFTKGHW